jgi:hypothetical protein
MPRRPKKARDLTDAEAIKKLFPKKAVEAADEEAKNPRSPAKTSPKDSIQDKPK